MTRTGTLSLVLLACALTTAAAAECLPFAPQVVTLTGTLKERSTRSDEGAVARAKARGSLVLALPDPVCVADDAAPDKKEEGVSEVVLMFGDKALRAFPQGVVRVTGTLQRSLVAQGSPRVVMLVRRVSPVSPESPAKDGEAKHGQG